MAEICQLVDDLATINLLDGTKYTLPEGFLEIRGARKYTWGGDNPQRDGANIMAQKDGNVTAVVTIDFGNRQAPGIDHDTLQTNIDAVDAFANRAADWQTEGYGSEAELQICWEHATGTRSLVILTGDLQMPANYRSIMLMDASYIPQGKLTLICRPFAYGPISATIENYVDNPSFERGAAPGDSWTEENGADVTPTADTTNRKYGAQSMQLVMVLDAGNDTGIYSDIITVPTAASTGYISCHGRHVAGDKVSLEVWDVNHAAWCALGSDLYWQTNGTSFVQVGATVTKPVGCTQIRIYIHVESGDSAAGATIQVDGVYFNPTVPTAPACWISSRNLINHNDSDADHLNTFDIEDVPGTMPARLRIAGLDGEIAQRVRGNPYNYVHNLEAESAGLGAGIIAAANGGASNGNVARTPNGAVLAWGSELCTFTMNTAMVDRYGRIRIMAAKLWAGAGSP